MAQQEENAANTVEEHVSLPKHIGTSKKVTDHLANQRTFLAWIRTGSGDYHLWFRCRAVWTPSARTRF